jgi:spore coat polysaccharide biosynthesis protein SpsF
LNVIDRIKNIKKSALIYLLISSNKSDDKLYALCIKKKIKVFRGNLKNLFLRFKQAIKKIKPDIVVRISGDSIFIDHRIIDKALDIFLNKKKIDIVTNIFHRTYPQGQSVEVFRSSIFLQVNSTKLSSYEKEHVSPYFYKYNKKYNIYNFRNESNQSKFKMTVDTKSDLVFFKKKIKSNNIFNKTFLNILDLLK